MLDFPLRLKSLKRTELIGRRHVGIDAVKLKKDDALETKPPQTPLAGRSQVFWVAVHRPLIGPRADETRLGGDHQSGRIRMQGLRDDSLTDFGPVRIGRVNEIDSQLHRAADDSNGFTMIRRLAPDSAAGDPHRAEAQRRTGILPAMRNSVALVVMLIPVSLAFPRFVSLLVIDCAGFISNGYFVRPQEPIDHCDQEPSTAVCRSSRSARGFCLWLAKDFGRSWQC